MGQEKKIIADKFTELASCSDLKLDISSNEDRLYGDRWVDFLRSAKVTLGTEIGANLFDDEGEIRWKTEQYLLDEPQATYEEVKLQIYKNSVEPQIMNQISPRIFEAIGHKLV